MHGKFECLRHGTAASAVHDVLGVENSVWALDMGPTWVNQDSAEKSNLLDCVADAVDF
jgi:hypothetical protein